jgi:hypothetical protein
MKGVFLSITEYNSNGNKVKKRLTPKNIVSKLDYKAIVGAIPLIREMTDRELLSRKWLERFKTFEGGRADIEAMYDFKDNLIYFNEMLAAIEKYKTKMEAIPVLKSRVIFKGKGSNYGIKVGLE